MESGGQRVTTRRTWGCVIVISALIAIPLIAFAVLRHSHALHMQAAMEPYRVLVSEHATMQSVLKRFGKPRSIIQDRATLLEWARNYPPEEDASLAIDSEVLIYNLEFESSLDIDPDIVYIFLDGRGVVIKVARGIDT